MTNPEPTYLLSLSKHELAELLLALDYNIEDLWEDEDQPTKERLIEICRKIRSLLAWSRTQPDPESVCIHCGQPFPKCTGGGFPEIGPDGLEHVPQSHDFTPCKTTGV